MEFLEMGSFDDDPNQDIVPEGVHGFEKDLKKDNLSNITSLIVYSSVGLSIMDKKQPPSGLETPCLIQGVRHKGLLYQPYFLST